MKFNYLYDMFGCSLNNVAIEKRMSKIGAVQLRYIYKNKEVKQYRLTFNNVSSFALFIEKTCDDVNSSPSLRLDQLINKMTQGQ